MRISDWSSDVCSSDLRSRHVLHGVVLLLYGAGIGLAWQHRGALSQPLNNSFGLLLSLKILLAMSIIGHYLWLAYWLKQGVLTSARARSEKHTANSSH